jgi:hypothetical protein
MNRLVKHLVLIFGITPIELFAHNPGGALISHLIMFGVSIPISIFILSTIYKKKIQIVFD